MTGQCWIIVPLALASLSAAPTTAPRAGPFAPWLNAPATQPTTEPDEASATQSSPEPDEASDTMPSTEPVEEPDTPPAATATTRPATRPIAAPSARRLPRSFVILEQRSIFIKGRGPLGGGPSTAGGRATAGAPAGGFRTPEEALVFNGVTQTADGAVAFVENLTTGKVMIVRAGQAIATGKVRAIRYNALEYTAGRKLIRIEIGQNLAGVVVAPSSQPSTQPTGQPTTGPTTAPAAPVPGSVDDVLERMRKRREQELGGK